MTPKQRAASAALELIADDMVVGMGTGSTADCFIDALGQALADGRFRGIRGVPTSVASERRARGWRIPVVSMPEYLPDVTVDGADEIDPQLRLIKGLGGALLREKIVAQHTRRLVIIADSSKVVPVLGSKDPLPVEVVPFCHETQARFLAGLGCKPELRRNADGSPYVTDNSNYIYHCRFDRIADPERLELTLKARAGVVETGLFIGLTAVALVADEHAVRKLTPAQMPAK